MRTESVVAAISKVLTLQGVVILAQLSTPHAPRVLKIIRPKTQETASPSCRLGSLPLFPSPHFFQPTELCTRLGEERRRMHDRPPPSAFRQCFAFSLLLREDRFALGSLPSPTLFFKGTELDFTTS